jgi:hypothetical protein
MLQARLGRLRNRAAGSAAIVVTAFSASAAHAQAVVLEHFTLIDGTGRGPGAPPARGGAKVRPPGGGP